MIAPRLVVKYHRQGFLYAQQDFEILMPGDRSAVAAGAAIPGAAIK
jgi:hypothetical protein